MRCRDCRYGVVDGFRGSSCPIRDYTPSSWSEGCSLASTRPEATKPIPTPAPTPDRAAKSNVPLKKSKGPNKTELNYAERHLTGKDARFEALTFRMSNGHKYTPDWVVFGRSGELTECHECKGGYALHSQQRARLAFDQCAREFPGIKWVWAVKKPKGWVIE